MGVRLIVGKHLVLNMITPSSGTFTPTIFRRTSLFLSCDTAIVLDVFAQPAIDEIDYKKVHLCSVNMPFNVRVFCYTARHVYH